MTTIPNPFMPTLLASVSLPQAVFNNRVVFWRLHVEVVRWQRRAPGAAGSLDGDAHFILIVGVQVLQSMEMLAFVHSRVKTPLLAAVSLHTSVGSPKS